ncbi:hypothetical protein [Serratia fonticola]|uniref:hypothetical protein n=1 Tax=Serratia fonticola TaxID=47917 RepID=UPI00192AB831|nr:hypothetical protein [Serratia fonticola]MBL5827292.1 hypothetical protein [Serratia fonticola]MBL5860045.1 hypothetical protein [Serratia fonticola]
MWLVSRARRRYLRSFVPSGFASISLPPKIDPYSLTWLKGGIDHVLKLAMMRLSYAGLLAAGQQKGKTFTRQRPSNQEKADQREQKLNRLERLVLMLGMGLYKLSMAWLNGHHNVGFLIALMLFFGLMYYMSFLRNRAGKAHLTAKGEKMLSQLSATLPKDKKSLKQLDIAMAAVALQAVQQGYGGYVGVFFTT